MNEARARAGLAGAQIFPAITASGSGSRSRGSERTGSGNTRTYYSVGFDASWELDIFGGIRRGIEAAHADLEGAEAGLYATRVSLAAEVALNYVSARSYMERLDIAVKNLESQTETRQLTEWRNQAGLASVLDVEQARGNLEQTRSRIPALRIGQAEAENRLAVLLGQAPGTVHEMLSAEAPVPKVPDEIAVGIPAQALGNRPDVRVAERRLAAETARVGQAVAARYPGFSLNASLGMEALTLGALDGGKALSRSVVGRVFATIFDAGRLRRQVEIRDAIQEQALIAYEASVLVALEEVENALVSLSENRNQQAALESAVEAARNAAVLARHRYTAGMIDFQTVLDTERTQFTVEESLAIAKANGASSLVRLYKALGGGWPSDVYAAEESAGNGNDDEERMTEVEHE
ncbi:MAG: efflux transporter outer membrane subunit [Syntrophorhabdaceae bacterium]|nr:efflux transporter outer membrane subunit [Syntrophorhabdaceae bacterium]